MDKIRHDFRVLREANVLKFHLSLESRQNLIAVQCYRPIEIGVIMNCVPITTDCISTTLHFSNFVSNSKVVLEYEPLVVC